MARSRGIKPGFYANEDLAECDIWARYIFPGLWMLASREGRLEDRPKRIKSQLLPYDGPDCEPLLQELAVRGFILRYCVGELRLIQIVNFAKHQNPHHREAPCKLPPPPGWVPPKAEKPEAGEPSDDAQAAGQTEESPGLLAEEATSQGGKAVLTPSSLTPSSLTPSSHDSLTPDLVLSTPTPRGPVLPKRAARKQEPAKTAAVWDAYAAAFRTRYGTDPVRNRQVNSMFSKLVDALGAQEAPEVAAFYVWSEEPFYVREMHPATLLLKDAPKLRTMWVTGLRPALHGPTSARAARMAEAVPSLATGRHNGFRERDYSAGLGPNGELLE
jgi:hypothetical protein